MELRPRLRAAAAAVTFHCCGLVALLPLIAGPIAVGYRGFVTSLGWLLMLVFCVMVLALEVHLLFDALLFRLASSHETEAAGLAA
ncbi:hypothetical protein ACC760_38315, partial [Rhizobium ruizarguesonis]